MLLKYEKFLFAYSMVFMEHVIWLTEIEYESKVSSQRIWILNYILRNAAGGTSFPNKS
jgi:hypothetical protein